MKLTIIGTGYVGLVTGACLAEAGHEVICVDNDHAKVASLQPGQIPIYEPGLERLVERNVSAKRLSFSSSTAEGVAKSDVIFIAVPTPSQADGSVDLSFIEKVAREIAGAMTSYKIIVDKSTVPVKTGDKVADTIKRYSKGRVDFDVVSNPEFLREGSAVADLMRPDRIVIGVRSQRAVRAMKEIYEPFGATIIVTDINSAELKKTRVEFISGAQNFVYQCDFDAMRSNRRECGRSCPWDGNGRADWPPVPERFARIWRELLSERFERLHQDCGAGGMRFCTAEGGAKNQRSPDEKVREEDRGYPLGLEGQENRSARTCVQAKHRRHPHVASD